jgi:hypothetical protein
VGPDDGDGRIPDVGHATRIAVAASALVATLRADPRVVGAYAECCLQDPAASYARLCRLATEELGLASYRWLPTLLAWDYLATMTTGGTAVLEAPVVPDLPRGRPRKDLEYIARDVGWWYRAEIQRPSETVYAIAKTDAHLNHSVVQTAIARTKVLLAKLDLSTDRIIGRPAAN